MVSDYLCSNEKAKTSIIVQCPLHWKSTFLCNLPKLELFDLAGVFSRVLISNLCKLKSKNYFVLSQNVRLFLLITNRLFFYFVWFKNDNFSSFWILQFVSPLFFFLLTVLHCLQIFLKWLKSYWNLKLTEAEPQCRLLTRFGKHFSQVLVELLHQTLVDRLRSIIRLKELIAKNHVTFKSFVW